MTGTLTLKNFGPIEEVAIDLKKFNVFIGPHGSGKSSIAKILSIIHAFDFANNEYRDYNEVFQKNLSDFQVRSYLKKNTFIEFENEDFYFKYERGKSSIDHKGDPVITSKNNFATYYFPAERVSLPMIGGSVFGLQVHDVALPKFFLQFGSKFELVKPLQKRFDIRVLDVHYEYKDNKDIVILKSGDTLELKETSSAIQATLPLLMILEDLRPHSIAVIEEPELNCFPDLQKKLIEHLVNKFSINYKKSKNLILTTHSPFVLSTLNNLIQAVNVVSKNPNKKAQVKKVIHEELWVNFNDINVYFLEHGKAKNIMNKKRKIIGTHQIDRISEKMGSIYNLLLELKYKSDELHK